jgi:hypothetical protein
LIKGMPTVRKCHPEMPMKADTDALAAMPFFKSLDCGSLQPLSEAADLARLGPNEVLFQPIGLACTMLGTAPPTGAQTITSSRLGPRLGARVACYDRPNPAVGLTFLDFALAGLPWQTVDLCNL